MKASYPTQFFVSEATTCIAQRACQYNDCTIGMPLNQTVSGRIEAKTFENYSTMDIFDILFVNPKSPFFNLNFSSIQARRSPCCFIEGNYPLYSRIINQYLPIKKSSALL